MDPPTATRPIYRVMAERESEFWFVKAPGLPRVFTQVRELDEADAMIREVAYLVLDMDPDSFDIELEVME